MTNLKLSDEGGAKMNDRELLELAAKSAGITLEWGIIEGGKQLQPNTKCFYRNSVGVRCEWNPLTDDGDAFRLAIKRGIFVYRYQEFRHELMLAFDADLKPFEATRRAIVCVSAEIWKKK